MGSRSCGAARCDTRALNYRKDGKASGRPERRPGRPELQDAGAAWVHGIKGTERFFTAFRMTAFFYCGG